MKLILLAICLFSFGCVTTQQSQPVWYSYFHNNPMQFEMDKKECAYQAQAFGYIPQRGNSIGHMVANSLETSWRQQDLFRACMESKGYVQQ